MPCRTFPVVTFSPRAKMPTCTCVPHIRNTLADIRVWFVSHQNGACELHRCKHGPTYKNDRTEKKRNNTILHGLIPTERSILCNMTMVQATFITITMKASAVCLRLLKPSAVF